jgi:hypothetical protein
VSQVLALADAAFGLVEQRSHRGGARRWGAELGRVKVEIQADDDGPVESQLRESAQLVAFGSGHLQFPALLLPGTFRGLLPK